MQRWNIGTSRHIHCVWVLLLDAEVEHHWYLRSHPLCVGSALWCRGGTLVHQVPSTVVHQPWNLSAVFSFHWMPMVPGMFLISLLLASRRRRLFFYFVSFFLNKYSEDSGMSHRTTILWEVDAHPEQGYKLLSQRSHWQLQSVHRSAQTADGREVNTLLPALRRPLSPQGTWILMKCQGNKLLVKGQSRSGCWVYSRRVK